MSKSAQNFAALNEHGTDFGNFYPVGHFVAAFPRREAAAAVQEALRGSGYTGDQCRYLSPEEVVAGTQRGLDSAGLLSMLGASLRMVQLYHDLAAQGSHFLLIRAPQAADDQPVLSAIRAQPHVLVQKFHRLTVETFAGKV